MVPPVRPVRLYEIGAFVEVGDNGDWPGVTVVLPDASVGDVPHVMDKVLDAPFDVPVPFNVALCSATLVAGSVVTVGGTTFAGVVNDKMPPKVVLFPLAYVPLTSK